MAIVIGCGRESPPPGATFRLDGKGDFTVGDDYRKSTAQHGTTPIFTHRVGRIETVPEAQTPRVGQEDTAEAVDRPSSIGNRDIAGTSWEYRKTSLTGVYVYSKVEFGRDGKTVHVSNLVDSKVAAPATFFHRGKFTIKGNEVLMNLTEGKIIVERKFKLVDDSLVELNENGTAGGKIYLRAN